MPHTPEEVLPRIFAALDDHRFDELPGFYAEAVQAETVVGPLSGRAQVVGVLRQVHQAIPTLQHLLTGQVVDFDPRGEVATIRANLVAVFCDAERKPTFEGASVWRGRLQREAGEWRVIQFAVTPVWSRGTPPSF